MPGSPSARLRLDRLRSPLAGPFSLEVAAGRCASITGPSGAGKSLFLRMIADLDVNDGTAELDGRPRQGFAPADWRRRVGFVPAEPGWWSERVRDHIARGRLDEARDLAGKLGLEPGQVDAEVTHLSTGERQRLALVRALLVDPQVLLLDEPTGALDQDSVAKVEALLREVLGRGTSILMVTHDTALATRLGAEHYRMADRRLTPT